MTTTNTCSVSSSVSMQYTCAVPALSGYDVQTYYLSSDATTCNWDSSLSYDGAVIEASPVGSCMYVHDLLIHPVNTIHQYIFSYLTGTVRPFMHIIITFLTLLPFTLLSCSPVPVSPTEVDTADSCMFDKDAGLNPFVTVYSGSTTCGTDAKSTIVTNLNPVCEDASATLGMPAWSKWYYRV